MYVIRKDFVATGESEERTDGEVIGDWKGTVVVSSIPESGDPVASDPIEVKISKSMMSFNLKQVVEALPKKPVTIDVAFNSNNVSGKTVEFEGEVPEDLVSQIKLYSELWLPLNEQKLLYMTQIRDNMRDEKWREAWISFNKLWDLDFEKPASFYYRYGQVLYKAGEPEKAKRHLKNYLRKAGASAKYYKPAKQMLGE